MVLTDWVRATYAPIDLQLPGGVSRSRDHNDAVSRGQGWTGSAGLVISYSVFPEPLSMREPTRGDHQVVDCSERIGGKVAAIRMFYSEATTASAQYVVARWVLDSGETLVVTATHPDPSRRGSLLGIVRSVKFRNAVR